VFTGTFADQPKKKQQYDRPKPWGSVFFRIEKSENLLPDTYFYLMTLVLSPRKTFKHQRSCFSHKRLDIFKKGWTAYVQ
jgi:hypothetical protein